MTEQLQTCVWGHSYAYPEYYKQGEEIINTETDEYVSRFDSQGKREYYHLDCWEAMTAP